jgi:hypothetical protein
MAFSATRIELADLTCSFLEVAIHAILYARRLYPASIFEQRAAFRCVAWMARSPEVSQCVGDIVESVRSLLLAGAAESLTIAILEASGVGPALEAYTFSLSIDAPQRSASTRATYADLEASFGAALVGLQAEEATRALLPPGTTWTALLGTHEESLGMVQSAGSGGTGGGGGGGIGSGVGCSSAALDALTPKPWARLDMCDSHLGHFAHPPSTDSRRMTRPIKSVRANALSVDVAFEDGEGWK